MSDNTALYKAMVINNYCNHSHLVLDVMKRLWMATSCSPVSGQMSFRDVTTEIRHYPLNTFKDWSADLDWGLTNNGWIRKMGRTISQKDFIAKGVRLAKIIGRFELKNPFVAVDASLPFVTDGKHGVKFSWPETGGYRTEIGVFPMDSTKCYRVLEDPCILDKDGMLLTPLSKVRGWIDDNFEQFADPFAVKQRGTKRKVEAVTISPGKRSQARKRTRVKKEKGDGSE